MTENLIIKFWGVRGSHPTPGGDTVYYGGNTACVEVNAGGHIVILDAGTGIIPLGRDLLARAKQTGKPVQATLLFSHLHHDHTQGFPFFAPAYNPTSRLYLFGPGAPEQALEELLARNQMPPAFPVTLRDMNAAKEIRSLSETQVINFTANTPHLGKQPTDDLSIRLMKSYAHPGGVYIYRIEWRGLSIVYATDTEGYIGTDRRLAAFAKGADLLIHDAQYAEEHYRGLNGWNATQGYGHSTPQMACELAHAAGVKQLALFHHDPTYSDVMVRQQESNAQQLFPNVFAAREGLQVILSHPTTANPPARLATQTRSLRSTVENFAEQKR
ncbi:MAG: MBL fold metallo-hydrolase [Anaerolineae bacterium]|nr:MAG: MBL fold metallo-hydrolase [Anaerolineae bacterium]